MGKSVFNSQFTDYEGTQTGAQVKELLNKAAATWRNDSSRKVNVTKGETTYSSANDIATVRSSINVNLTYTVSVTYDSNGYVNSITIN